MNHWKIAFFILLGFWILTICFMIYHSIDLGYTVAYQNDSYTSARRDLNVIAKIAATEKYNRSAIKNILNKDSLDFIEKDSLISLENLSFVFNKDCSFLRIDWNN